MEKLLALVTVSHGIYGRWLFRRLISGTMIVLCLTTITAMMMATLMVSLFYDGYLMLRQTGLQPHAALFLVDVAGMLAIILMVLFIQLYLRRLRTMPHRVLQQELPQVAYLQEVAEAFVRGFNHPQVK